MLQYKPYKIFVVHSEHSQKRARSEVNAALAAKDYKKAQELEAAALKKTDSDPLWKDDVTQYETEICRQLRKIHSSEIGKIFFRTLNPDTEIWIISWITDLFYVPPEKRIDKNQYAGCYCAKTSPFYYQIEPTIDITKGRGNTYILFNPNHDFQEDTLLHELVHAYRYTYGKFEGDHVLSSGEYNSEEFLAMMIQNIYLSSMRKPLQFTYRAGFVESHPKEFGTKEEIYEHFISDWEILETIGSLLRHEYLAMLMANFHGADFNPFRDYPLLRKKYSENLLKRFNPLSSLTR